MNNIISDKNVPPVATIVSIIFAIVSAGYMLPWMIATLRGKSNHWGVFWVNLLLGWTIVGWVIALIMACTSHQIIAVRQRY